MAKRETRVVTIGAVLLLHAALLVGLQQAARHAHRVDARHDQPRSSVRMITIHLPPLPKPVPAPVAKAKAERPDRADRADRAERSPSRREARPDPEPRSAARSPSAIQVPAPEIDRAHQEPRTTVVIAAPAPASGASGPSGRDLLYGAATKRAVRQATQGQPLLAERADQASQAPEKVEASAKLGKEIMKGATGDCLKGEYAGGGMGLLSAPFWLLAEARGKCRR
ncbi:hypothetical protein [Mitsuaria sp. GD03876]|uniref:hypothetical protein n=1 Tax=Mitsuaria sp. GD03876 TaxID=2975399 RepID=UPI00244739AC|nr:hypothetical protein [Mitsuaria sp. GD03876]MDH0865303.1 hypothetical protein [Mitsuaria sp. GD03876]